MPRHKSAKSVAIKPWLSARTDCREGRFIQVGNSLLLSSKDSDGKERNPFLRLNAGARLLYLSMSMESGGEPVFTFTHGAAKKYGFSSTSFDRAAAELEAAGFIETVSDKELQQYAPKTFRFSNKWKSGRTDNN